MLVDPSGPTGPAGVRTPYGLSPGSPPGVTLARSAPARGCAAPAPHMPRPPHWGARGPSWWTLLGGSSPPVGRMGIRTHVHATAVSRVGSRVVEPRRTEHRLVVNSRGWIGVRLDVVVHPEAAAVSVPGRPGVGRLSEQDGGNSASALHAAFSPHEVGRYPEPVAQGLRNCSQVPTPPRRAVRC